MSKKPPIVIEPLLTPDCDWLLEPVPPEVEPGTEPWPDDCWAPATWPEDPNPPTPPCVKERTVMTPSTAATTTDPASREMAMRSRTVRATNRTSAAQSLGRPGSSELCRSGDADGGRVEEPARRCRGLPAAEGQRGVHRPAAQAGGDRGRPGARAPVLQRCRLRLQHRGPDVPRSDRRGTARVSHARVLPGLGRRARAGQRPDLSASLLIYGSLACSAAFFVLAGVIYTVRRPPVPPTLPPMSDLGPHSPAAANLLPNRRRLTPEAVPATLLDLAARKLVEIDESQPHVYQCRIDSGPPSGLAPYQRRLHDLLPSKALRGVVPAAALTAGPAERAQAWLRSFEAEVNDEAKLLGPTEPRRPRRPLSVAGIFTAGALLLFLFAAQGDAEMTFLWFLTGAVAFGTVGLSNPLFRAT